MQQNANDEFFSGLRALIASGESCDIDLKGVVLRVVCDQFCARADHSPSEAVRLGEAILGAAATQPRDVGTANLEAVCRHVQAPLSLLEGLIARGGAPAAAALRHGRSLGRAQLLPLASQGPASLASAIAERADLDGDVVTALLRRPEAEILISLAGNARAPLERAAFVYLVSRGRRDPGLARALLARGELPCDSSPLFLSAAAEQRQAMIRAARLRGLGIIPDRAPSASDTLGKLAGAASVSDFVAGAELIAIGLGIALNDARVLLKDDGGEPLALALCAFSVEPRIAREIVSGFLGGRDPARAESLVRLAAELAPQTARRLLSGIYGRPVMRENVSRRQTAAQGMHAAADRERRQTASGQPIQKFATRRA